MIIIEEHNSAVNSFYNKLKETHNNLFLCNSPKVIEKPERSWTTKNDDIDDGSADNVVFCNTCKHSGNPELTAEWFRSGKKECPRTGCNCRCVYGNLTRRNNVPTATTMATVATASTASTMATATTLATINIARYQETAKPRNRRTYNYLKKSYSGSDSVINYDSSVTLEQYNKWYNDIERGITHYNAFTAKPYLKFAERNSIDHNTKRNTSDYERKGYNRIPYNKTNYNKL